MSSKGGKVIRMMMEAKNRDRRGVGGEKLDTEGASGGRIEAVDIRDQFDDGGWLVCPGLNSRKRSRGGFRRGTSENSRRPAG